MYRAHARSFTRCVLFRCSLYIDISDMIQVDHPMGDMEQQWRKAVSLQRKRAVMACFRMVPVYNISRSVVCAVTHLFEVGRIALFGR